MKRLALGIAAGLLSSAAAASDPIAAGYITSLSYRGGYYIFKVTSGSTNACAPCPADPGAMQSGGYCWIAETKSAQIAMLLTAYTQGRQLWGRVNDLATNCTVYQMTVLD